MVRIFEGCHNETGHKDEPSKIHNLSWGMSITIPICAADDHCGMLLEIFPEEVLRPEAVND